MKKILFYLIILSFLIGAFGILAQNDSLPAPGLLPDNPFYFLKTWKEAIQTFFTFGAENKAKQYLHLAEVRLAEYQKMLEKGKTEIAQKTLAKYEKQLNHALQKIEELKNKGKDTKDISQKVEDTLNKHIEVLENNLQKAPEAAQEGLKNAIENASKAIEKVGGKTNKEKGCINSGGKVSTSLCCKTVSDFPNLCLIGPCGCSATDSHQVKICDCGPGKCFNGSECIEVESSQVNFEKIGNLVDGVRKVNWSLLYEEPGKPALKVSLVFTSESICDFGQGEENCLTAAGDIGEVGNRVQIEGELEGNAVTVVRLLHMD